MKIGKKYVAPLALLMISVAGTAYAVSALFTQTFPAIPAKPTACPTLTPDTGSISPGSSGQVLFDCSGSSPFGTTPAFSLSGGNTLTPTFALPTGYTSLYVYVPGSNPPDGSPPFCARQGVPLAGALTTGTPIALGAASYDYCAVVSVAPAPGLGTFTINWGV